MRARVPILLLTGILAVTGCGNGDGDARVRIAERQLADAQEALAGAQAELAGQVDAFCRTSSSYVTALDRYGDLITGTAPTVGDVKGAGADLAEPRSEVVTSVEKLAAARQAVADAEKDLAEAAAAVTSARTGASLPPAPSPSPSPTPEPRASVADTTVSRVKQADADFTAAQAGIGDQTPMRQASERFNAAAVALEMSWLDLLGEAGCVTEDQRGRARDYTLAVQKSLSTAGYYRAEVDGVYGPATVDAVRAVQKAHGLTGTGTVDKATDAALQEDLRAKGGAAAEAAIASTAAVQQTLKLAGFWSGPVDGTWTDELTEALQAFQKNLGVEPTGTVDAATIAAVEHTRAAKTSPAPSVSPP
ncbi:peptidoglycan-binding domain-containing protein [Actinoplanes flavus]|uniref:Peptidoglycan-binding protein n=1 Tax=Actinoplanes flavus TaxID=2820290 RepID=A0ABS3UTG3_9ACTN|nr:peptidoglycan-binding protein [Actinoplanes flavus]MBO3741886.1 peptidoglycan-binding protein [Actinoplanes flavus]